MEAGNMESWALMEDASNALSVWVQNHYRLDQEVFLIFVGPGNNGGDGAALARLLYELDAEVALSAWSENSSYSPDNEKNQGLARELGIPFLEYEHIETWVNTQKKRVIGIDALFGIGFKGNMRAYYLPAVHLINNRALLQEVLSVDMPSGLPVVMEIAPESEGVVHSNHTLSFEFPKPSFFFRNHQDYVGHWHILDIGFDQAAIEVEKAFAFSYDRQDLQKVLKPRKRFDYKNSMGHVCLCGGSRGKYGAMVLASRACLRGGTGLLTVAAPQSAFNIIQSTVPEAMYLENEGKDYLKSAPEFSHYDALGIGPGMDQKEDSLRFLEKALASGKPMVIDADALNLLAKHKALMDLLHDQCILTPHDGEFKRLVGEWSNENERLEKLKQFTQKYSCTVLLKGPYSLILSSKLEAPWINTTGNPGMAVGGMGDALTGLLTALLGRGYAAEEAACLGAYVHGRAGDYAVTEFGLEALLPSDLVDYLADVWMEMYGSERESWL